MTRRPVFILAAAAALTACGDGSGPSPARPPVAVRRAEDPRPLRVLFIGNSLTFFNDLPIRTAEIAARDTTLRAPDLQSVVRSGYTLRQHWALGEARLRLDTERWDYVVLQEASLSILQGSDSTAAYVARFDSVARAHGTRTMMFLAWTFGELPSATQDTVSGTYRALAASVDALVAPVGIAWQRVRALRPDLTLYLPDSIHPGAVGTYLGACTFVAALYRRTPEGLAGTDAVGDKGVEVLDDATARLLQQTAWTVTIPYLPAAALPETREAAVLADDGLRPRPAGRLVRRR